MKSGGGFLSPDVGDSTTSTHRCPPKLALFAFVTTDASRPSSPTLDRALGLLDSVGIGFGAIVGAGIFVVLGVAAGVAGPAILVALLLAAVAATANALSSAQLAAEYPHAGGTYEYGYRVLSPWAGFVAGWMFLASKIAAVGTVALGLGGYLEVLVPDLPPRAVGIGAVVLFTVLNWFGIRKTSRLNLAVVGLSTGSLLILVIAGAGAVDFENLRPFAPGGWRGTLEASAILFFAYTGYARIATLGEEVRDPRTTIPRAIILTIVGTVLLYLAVAAVAVGVAGAPDLAEGTAPLATVARGIDASWLITVIAVGGTAAMLGVILSQILGLSRMAFAMARRGDLPSLLERTSRFGVPGNAILVTGGLGAVVASTGALREVASAAAFTILVYYGIANVAALRMPDRAKRFPDGVPIVGLIACAGLALSLSMEIVGIGLLVLLAGVAWRYLRLLVPG